jgi:hypothetical protein
MEPVSNFVHHYIALGLLGGMLLLSPHQRHRPACAEGDLGQPSAGCRTTRDVSLPKSIEVRRAPLRDVVKVEEGWRRDRLTTGSRNR